MLVSVILEPLSAVEDIKVIPPLDEVAQDGIPPETVNTCPEVPIANLAGVLADDA